ncbi:tyrosine-type recombinase/integrase [Burkholderiaceae bacterium DAT-1]|nr:tyrosine-type recombinase/integrase [Burkholderiaceae bacterium DAT-1]
MAMKVDPSSSSSNAPPFTDKAIRALKPHDANSSSKSRSITCPLVKGLRIEVTKSGQKSFWFAATIAGHKRHLRIGTFGAITVEQARTIALGFRAQIERGGNPFNENQQLKAVPLFSKFSKEHYVPHASGYKRSIADDEAKLNQHLIPAFGKYRLSDITTRCIDTYLNTIKNLLSPATANRHRSLLSKMFSLAVKWEIVATSPVTHAIKFKEEIKHQKYLNKEEAKRLVEAAQHETNQVAASAIMALLLTGCRREEILQARWEHLDIDAGTLYLPTTKAGKSRHVTLNEAAISIFRKQVRVAGSPWIFPGKDPSKPLNNPRKAFTRILEAAGLSHMRIHDLRHSFCSLLVENGVSLYTVQHLVGHASPSTTQRYAHFSTSGLRVASDVMANVVMK